MSSIRPIPRKPRRVTLAAAVGQTVFSFSDQGPVWDTADIVVKTRVAPATRFGLVSTGFSVALVGDGTAGATVTFVPAPRASAAAPAVDVRIESRRVANRVTDVTRQARIHGPSMELELDKAVTDDQELRRDLDDVDAVAVRVPEGEPSLELPAAASRGDKLLGFDALGQPIPVPGTGPSPTPNDGSVTDTKVAAPPTPAQGVKASKIAVLQAGIGAVWRDAQAKLIERISPLDFGAAGDNATNDAAALQAAFNHVMDPTKSGDCCVLDLCGRTYRINTPIVVTGGPYQRVVMNGMIRAGAAAASPLLDFSGVSAMTRIMFRNINLNAWGTGQSGLLLHRTQGILIENCEVTTGASGYGIKDLNIAAAAEVRIANCLISGPAATGNTGIGIELAGHDSAIQNNIVRYFASHVRLLGGSHQVLGNHIYGYQQTATAEHPIGVHLVGASTGDVVINGNYIDNVSVRLDGATNVTISDNYFLTFASSGNSPAFVVFSPVGANFGIVNLLIENNQFVGRGTATVESIRLNSSGGSLDGNAVYGFSMRRNGFFGCNRRTSHPAGAITLAAATTGSVDLSGQVPLGLTIKAMRAAVFNAPSGAGVAYRTVPVGGVVFAEFASAVTGKVNVTGTVNNEDGDY